MTLSVSGTQDGAVAHIFSQIPEYMSNERVDIGHDNVQRQRDGVSQGGGAVSNAQQERAPSLLRFVGCK